MNSAAKLTIKAHLANGLDVTREVAWVNHLGQVVPGRLVKEGKFWAVLDFDGNCLQNGGPGARYVFIY
jgi:hypothetical protein